MNATKLTSNRKSQIPNSRTRFSKMYVFWDFRNVHFSSFQVPGRISTSQGKQYCTNADYMRQNGTVRQRTIPFKWNLCENIKKLNKVIRNYKHLGRDCKDKFIESQWESQKKNVSGKNLDKTSLVKHCLKYMHINLMHQSD